MTLFDDGTCVTVSRGVQTPLKSKLQQETEIVRKLYAWKAEEINQMVKERWPEEFV